MSFYFLICVLLITVTKTSAEDWTNGCSKCQCGWVSGKQTANCENLGLIDIPKDLSSTIQYIDFSNNEFIALDNYEFSRANLRNVHTLSLENCSLEQVSQSTFFELPLLIELNLNRNKINNLSNQTFRHNIRLLKINLSYNNIDDLPAGLFNVSSLQVILLHHNHIQEIFPNTFCSLPKLRELDLSYNRIQRITFDLKITLPKLYSLNLEDNPWVCDCHLQNFRQSVIQQELGTNPIKCDSPLRLKGQLWQDPLIFSCDPEIVMIYIQDPKEDIASAINITLVCLSKGEPIPDVEWIHNGHVIKNSNLKYTTHKNMTNDVLWSFLSITEMNDFDYSDYKCIARNAGGQDEQSIILPTPIRRQHSYEQLQVFSEDAQSNENEIRATFVLWTVSILIVLFVALIALFVYYIRQRALKPIVEEKFCVHEIIDVNPVAKPPRSVWTPEANSDVTYFAKNSTDDLDDDNSRQSVSSQAFSQLSDESYSPYLPCSGKDIREQQNIDTSSLYQRAQYYNKVPSDFHSYLTLQYRPSPPSHISPMNYTIYKQGYVTIPRRCEQIWQLDL